jgi:hypothetical protein
MKKLMRFLPVAACVLVLASGAAAQRARTMSDPQPTPQTQPDVPPAPPVVKAKYEGGVIGYPKKQTGTLVFDDPNHRLVFRDKEQREYVPLPYEAITALYPSTRAVQPTSARVIGAVPAPYGLNMLSLLARKKVRYMVVQYYDPDTKAAGITSFKLDSKELLESVLVTTAQKAELVQRGEAWVRKPKDVSSTP